MIQKWYSELVRQAHQTGASKNCILGEGDNIMAHNTNASAQPFGIRDKVGYLFGDLANDFTFIFASSYLMKFYTDVLGVSAAMVGVLFLVARFVDAFTDVGMGRLVDTLPAGKNGRFRPWLKRMAIPPVHHQRFDVSLSGRQSLDGPEDGVHVRHLHSVGFRVLYCR